MLAVVPCLCRSSVTPERLEITALGHVNTVPYVWLRRVFIEICRAYQRIRLDGEVGALADRTLILQPAHRPQRQKHASLQYVEPFCERRRAGSVQEILCTPTNALTGNQL